ncbi:MAG: alkaline phosphatase [Desulfobacterium sp.]|nr:alkaline phosphatase [Desulfobacterium sp.]
MNSTFRKRGLSFGMALALLVSLVPAQAAWAKSGKSAKYVILMIGDGMGIPQRMATEEYTGKKLVMDTLPAQGLTTTRANDRFITGSAASATALASGKKTNINYIGVDENFTPVATLAELARDQGKKVGIVSSVSIDHATPAAFYAHVKTRKMYHEIDVALAESGFDFFGGGGLKDPQGKKSKAPLGDAIAMARENGYKIVSDKKTFMNLSPRDGKVIAWNHWLQDAQALPYAMDMGPGDITLPEFTGKAIEMLDNKEGFFLMVEGGKIDWACHANDATASLENNIAFDKSVQVALDFYRKHPADTLLVVTGDHECGGLTLGFAGTKYASHFDVLSNQKVSFQKFTDEILETFKNRKASETTFANMKPIIQAAFGLKFEGDAKADPMVLKPFEQEQVVDAFNRSMNGVLAENKDPELYILYGGYDPLAVTLTHLLSQKAGLGWTSYKHTGIPVSTSAIGVGSDRFNGYYDNTDIALKIMAIMGIEAKVHLAAQ